MLSKFAILFFILALAIFLFTFSQNEKAGLCSVEAGSQAQLISNSINSVINNPVEDQQLIIKLPPAITLGNGLSTYAVNITYINQSSGPSLISIQANSNTGNCNSNPQTVSLPSNILVTFFDDTNSTLTQINPQKIYSINQMVLTARPSNLGYNQQFYVLIIKCTSKTNAALSYLFITTCTQTDASACSGYGIYNTANNQINNDCGFV